MGQISLPRYLFECSCRRPCSLHGHKAHALDYPARDLSVVIACLPLTQKHRRTFPSPNPHLSFSSFRPRSTTRLFIHSRFCDANYPRSDLQVVHQQQSTVEQPCLLRRDRLCGTTPSSSAMSSLVFMRLGPYPKASPPR